MLASSIPLFLRSKNVAAGAADSKLALNFIVKDAVVDDVATEVVAATKSSSSIGRVSDEIVLEVLSPTYKELRGLNSGFQAHHILPQYLGEMLGYTRSQMLNHPATLITQFSHTGRVNPNSMHKIIDSYLPPMYDGKKVMYTREEISSGLRDAYHEMGRPELFDSIEYLIK